MSGTELANRSALTEKLLSSAKGHSLQEIADSLSLKVEDVADKYARLYEDRGWMTERQEERHYLIEMEDMITDAKNQLTNTTNAGEYASVFNSIMKAMQLIAARFDARKKLVDEDIAKISQNDARIFGNAMEIAITHMAIELGELYPDLPRAKVFELAKEGLAKAKVNLKANTQ